jgi:hypothetical protein
VNQDREHRPIYQVRIQGYLDHEWSEWLGGLAIEHLDGGDTLLEGEIADQSALHGLLVKIGDLGLPLLSVHRKIHTIPARRQES